MRPDGEAATRVLIVEDDVDVAETLAEVLENEGFRTATARNGLEALEILRGSRPHPDLILLDMTMPVVDGWGFRREQLRMREAAGIPVLVLTADGDARRKAAAMAAQGHLSKPVGITTLLTEVERVCGRTGG